MNKKSYKVANTYKNFSEKYIYLKKFSTAFDATFGNQRYLNQQLYSSDKWKRVRRDVILRDNGCDLGCPEFPIHGTIIVHHINPITPEDIINDNPCLYDMDNLITTSKPTHDRIHFGSDLPSEYIDRQPNDTKLW